MKRISNMDCLEQLLCQENSNWQEAIFEQTGVAVLPEVKKAARMDTSQPLRWFF